MTTLPWLAPGEPFPPTSQALNEPNGLLAAGGDLSVDTLIDAYRQGIFPWFSQGEPILWWSPAPRTLLYPAQLRVSRSLRKVLRQQHFAVRQNTCFAEVIRACATTPRAGQDGTWITADMQQAYIRLHQAGIAHSIEVFFQNRLAGGLYGVQLGQMFFGESMFSHQSDASKVALVHLCQMPSIAAIDCQVPTAHLLSLGAQQVSRTSFEATLRRLIPDNIDTSH